MPPIDQRHRDHERRPQPRLDHVAKQPADDHDRDRAGDDQPAEPLVLAVAAGQRPRRRGDQLRDVGAKIRHHRQQRADVARDIERDPEPARIPAEKRARENQVARARHRQELGESLHDAQQRRRDQIHR